MSSLVAEAGAVDGGPGAPAAVWAVRLNQKLIGQVWRSQHSDQYTLHVPGLTLDGTSLDEVLGRAQRALGVDIPPLGPDDGPPYQCRAHEHAVRRVRYLGPVQFEICADPQCAKIFAMCEHSKNTWNTEGTTLTCDFCGRDVT